MAGSDEIVVLKGTVVSIISAYERDYDTAVYSYDLTKVPTCTLQLDGEFNASNTIEVQAHLQHGAKYEFVMRPVVSFEKSALTKALEDIEPPKNRKFNDDI